MSYSPTAEGIAAANRIAANVGAALGNTAMADSIAGGNTAPAGFVDGILAAKCIAIYGTASGQSIPTGLLTIVNFNTVELDTDSAVTTGAAWKFTVPTGKAGVYHVSGTIGFTSYSVAAQMFPAVVVNGAERFRGNRFVCAATDANPYVVYTGLVSVSAGDQIQVQVFQAAGVAKSLEAATGMNRVSIFRVA